MQRTVNQFSDGDFFFFSKSGSALIFYGPVYARYTPSLMLESASYWKNWICAQAPVSEIYAGDANYKIKIITSRANIQA